MAEPIVVDNGGLIDYNVLVDDVVDGTLGSGAKQYVGIMDGTIGGTNKAEVDADGRLATKVSSSANVGAQTIVAGTVTANTTLIAADGARVHLSIYNDSTATLTVLMGAGTQSSTVFTTKIPPAGLYEVPDHMAPLRASGAWATATGSARITAVT